MAPSIEQIRAHIDGKTKPPGSLGRLEELGLQLCSVLGTLSPEIRQPVAFVCAADHGIAVEGVSAYPQTVTAQMVANIVSGGAAINALAGAAGMRVVVVDTGVAADVTDVRGPVELLHEKVGRGTRNAAQEPAMSEAEAQRCLALGGRLVARSAGEGANLIALGEMGIANSSTAALLCSNLLDLPLELCVGRGTGVDDEGLERKREVLKRAATLHGRVREPVAAIAAFGGYEIATMAGAMTEAARRGILVMIDGFIATAAYAIAEALEPAVREVAVFSHRSAEAGHDAALKALGARPLLDLELRLGEGTGAALALPLLRAAARFVTDMASFESAGVDHRQG